jgi:xanthine dehydrogenase accessory factor
MEEKWATREEWNKIHAPVGIKIHSKTVQEIAVSIAAQLVLIRNQKKEIRNKSIMENEVSVDTTI